MAFELRLINLNIGNVIPLSFLLNVKLYTNRYSKK